MGYPTAGDIIQDTLLEVGLVTGTSVQTYAEPQVLAAVNRMFAFLFNKQKWDHLWDWQLATLDGTTGLFTAALTGVRQYEDIDIIRIGDQNNRAVTRSMNTEHLYVTGSDPMYWRPLAWDHADAVTKFVKLYPITATGTVEVHCGHRPERFVANADVVPFDRDIMTLGTIWYTVAADGLNPSAAEVAQGTFDIAYSDYVSRYNAREIGHGRGNRNSDTFRL